MPKVGDGRHLFSVQGWISLSKIFIGGHSTVYVICILVVFIFLPLRMVHIKPMHNCHKSNHSFFSSDCQDEPLVVILPDISKQEIELILSLLYCGSANIYKQELSKVSRQSSLCFLFLLWGLVSVKGAGNFLSTIRSWFFFSVDDG